jgi:GAF domain-containing protein
MFTPGVKNHQTLLDTLPYQLSPTDPWVTTLSNAAAHLAYYLEDVNWCGFYLWDGEKLILGPFQGLPACTQIALGRGVCGTALQQKATLRVDRVHDFPGHIACDGASQSELVIPLIQNGQVIGVLDIDSPTPARFTQEDQDVCEKAVAIILDNLPTQVYNL